MLRQTGVAEDTDSRGSDLQKMLMSGWGNYPRAQTRLLFGRGQSDIASKIRRHDAVIARGSGRSYGDAAIGYDATLALSHSDRIIAFDPQNSRISVEAGVTLVDVIDFVLPRGFFPAVVPGTRHVTIGGMVAANVHGKNHHTMGGFGNYVEQLTLVIGDGSERVCSVRENPDLFRATIGGMGLTGVISDVTFRLLTVQSAFIRCQSIIATNLDAVMEALESAQQSTYTVAWIDCLARGASIGRSVLFRGEHARPDELAVQGNNPFDRAQRSTWSVPFYFPQIALSRLTVGAFNALYFRRQSPSIKVVPLMEYFFPLDAISNWNRLYGYRGFVQHQSVIPKSRSRQAIGEMLDVVSSRGNPSFLAVLKLLGPDDAGLLSFPLEGYTLTLDFPVSDATFRLLDELDRHVINHGGRIYLAKDARQSRELMEAGYPRLAAFREVRRDWRGRDKFRSLLSERLAL